MDGEDNNTTGQVEERFEAILRQYGGLLRSAVARFCPKGIGIQFEDVEQEARIRLLRALRSEREIRDPASYLYRIAATAAIDAVRRVKARRERQMHARAGEGGEEVEVYQFAEDPERAPDRIAERRQIVRRVDEALASLAENRRRAVRLHLQGFTTDEIAVLLGWTEPKARNLVYRGLADLREQLRRHGYEVDD